jgi:hypothetical protein
MSHAPPAVFVPDKVVVVDPTSANFDTIVSVYTSHPSGWATTPGSNGPGGGAPFPPMPGLTAPAAKAGEGPATSLGYSLAGGVEGGRGARIHEQVFLVGEDWVLDA